MMMIVMNYENSKKKKQKDIINTEDRNIKNKH